MSPSPSITIRLRTSSPSARRMPRTPVAVRPIERTSLSAKRTALPLEANSMTSLSPPVSATPISASLSSRLIAILPRCRRKANSVSGVFLTVPLRVAKNTKRSSRYSRTGSTAWTCSPGSSGIQLMIGRPRALRAGIGQLVHRQPEHAAGAGEGEQRVVRVDQPQLVDEILVLGRRRVAAAAAAALRTVGARRLALGVTRMRQRDHHVFRRDQVEDVEVFLAGADLRTTRVAEFFLEVAQLGADDVEQHVRVLEDADQARGWPRAAAGIRR